MALTVTGVDPASGPEGTLVVITGTDFTEDTSRVRFGTYDCGLNYSVISDTEISCVAPVGTGAQYVLVTTPAGTNPNGAQFTVATYEGGSDGTGTADNQMLYVWVCLLSFYFLRVRNAGVQIGIVGVAYGWLLAAQEIAAGDAATRWVVTMTALLTAGFIVARQRRSNDALVDELTGRARVDPLTGLLNRNALEERAAVEFARARRGRGAVAIVVADLDDFKTINDSLGHPAGDQVLRRVAAVFDQETRAIDAVARVGGDEFAILLPGATATAAWSIAERLRVAVRRSAADMHLRLTVSAGIAVGPPDGNTLDELWTRADRAMYLAKRGGGDEVATAAELEGAMSSPLVDAGADPTRVPPGPGAPGPGTRGAYD